MLDRLNRPRVIATVILACGVLSAAAIVLGGMALLEVRGQAGEACRQVAELRLDIVTFLEPRVGPAIRDEEIARFRPGRCP